MSYSLRMVMLFMIGVATPVSLFSQTSDSTAVTSTGPNAVSATNVTSPPSNASQSAKKVVEIPVLDGAIDGDQLYQQVISKLHWTTALTTTIAKELVVNEVGVSSRIPLDSLRPLCNLWPSAFALVSKDSGSPDNPTHLRVDMIELETKWKDQKLSLRQWLANRRQSPIYELCGQVGFNGRSEQKRIVVVLAGLHGGVESAIEYAKVLNLRTGSAACAFRYPNDAPIAESADYLYQTLSALHAQVPNRKIILVTHSMGGLVARSTIEQLAAKDQKCLGVTQLIAIGPPNQGSIFAEYAGLLEGAEIFQRLLQGSKGNRLFSAVLDGFNEAPADLVPGSDYLKTLAKGQRHPAVRYTIIAGDTGMIGAGLSSLGNELLDRIAARTTQGKSLQERAQKLLNSPEFQKGSGDGVVTLQSAKLDGVKDTVVLPVNHLDWNNMDSDEGKSILQLVVERIGVEM